jgi:D-threo-aldose 1-dehydrogenase
MTEEKNSSNIFLSDKLLRYCVCKATKSHLEGEEVIVTTAVSVRRKVGATPLELPVFGFGSAHLGELYNLVNENDSCATLNAAWGAGVRYYDTAPWYGRGLSEHRLGGLLRTKPRAEFRITTKVGRTLRRPRDLETFSRAPWTGGLNFEVDFDYSYDGVMRSYEQALQRLALDTVDALVIHDLDELFLGGDLARFERQLFDSGIRALSELKASGAVKAYGMGINRGATLETTAAKVNIDFALVAMPYTLLDQASLHTGMAACVKRGVSVIIGAPFASGILATGSQAGAKYAYGDASPEIRAKVQGIEAVCKAHGVQLRAAALQFPLAHPAVVSVIPGAARASEVTENIASLEATIPAAFWSDLKDRNLIDRDSPIPLGA